MTKEEFIKDLRESLYTEIPSIEIENNVRYYSEYIDNQLRSGRTIDQVMGELGDPRLIARTIIETSKLGKTNYNNTYDNSYQEEYPNGSDSYNDNEHGYSKTYNFNGKIPLRYRILGIAILALIIMVIIFVGSLAIQLFVSVGIPILLMYLLVRIISRR
ncbi:DUF1700 domain-containing protein [Anaerosporobacter sp.]